MTSAPAVITRLVTATLVLVAGAVVVSAAGPGRSIVPRAKVAADSAVPVLVPSTSPVVARIRWVQRTGDAILLRVDPVGNLRARTLVLSPGATVTASRAFTAAAATGTVPLNRLLSLLADPAHADAIRALHFRLSYDATGEIVGLAEVEGG